jgi:hypothetical protein
METCPALDYKPDKPKNAFSGVSRLLAEDLNLEPSG